MDDGRGQDEYMNRVLEAYRKTPGTMGTVRCADQALVAQLYLRGVSVSVIVGSIADGDTPEQIIRSWPQLTAEDITAALKFAAKAASRADVAALQSDAE